MNRYPVPGYYNGSVRPNSPSYRPRAPNPADSNTGTHNGGYDKGHHSDTMQPYPSGFTQNRFPYQLNSPSASVPGGKIDSNGAFGKNSPAAAPSMSQWQYDSMRQMVQNVNQYSASDDPSCYDKSNFNDFSQPPPPMWANAPHPSPITTFYDTSVAPPSLERLQPPGVDSHNHSFLTPPLHGQTSSTIEQKISECRKSASLTNVGTPSINRADIARSENQEDTRLVDQKWVTSWLREIGRTQDIKHRARPPTSSKCDIQEARQRMREAVVLSTELRQMMEAIRDNRPVDSEKPDMKRVDEVKTRLIELKGFFDDKEMTEALEKKIKRITRKRDSQRRRRQCLYHSRLESEEKSAQLHRKLDEWQSKLCEKAAQSRRFLRKNVDQDKEMKKSADLILSEVLSKLSDVKRSTDLITALTKLRQVRKGLADANGVPLPSQSEYDFAERKTTLEKLLAKQKEIYDAEKKTLEVMLEMEKEDNEEKEKEEVQQRALVKQIRLEKRTRKSLFGSNEKVTISNPVYSHNQYHIAGWHQLPSFITIRQDWDMCLVLRGTPGGSRVPVNWVVPPEPSSDAWTATLNDVKL